MSDFLSDWWWLILIGVALWMMAAKSKPAGPPPEPPRALTADERAQILELRESGQKIAAIKLFREFTACGLKDAKDAVEAMEA